MTWKYTVLKIQQKMTHIDELFVAGFVHVNTFTLVKRGFILIHEVSHDQSSEGLKLNDLQSDPRKNQNLRGL